MWMTPQNNVLVLVLWDVDPGNFIEIRSQLLELS